MTTATILIKDEVNCKLQNLDLSTRRKLSGIFSYLLPHARHTPAFKLGRWNGMVSFFQLSGSTFINLLDEIIPVLIDEGYNIEVDDKREYSTQFEFTKISADSFSHITWPDDHPKAGQPIVLREHQVTAIENYLLNPQSVQEIATGAGKTIITAALSQLVEPYGRSIVIVPNKSLVTQTEEDYINMGLDVGVFYGNRKEYIKTHTICTWQSLNSLYKKTKKGEAHIEIGDFLDDVVCVIVDEVHSAKADALKTMLTSAMAHIPLRWGLTGTIPKEKFDFQAIRCSIGNIVGQVTAKELQDKGILANCHVNIKQLQDARIFNNYQSELKYLLSDPARLDYIAGMISDIALSGNTLVLVDRVNAGKELIGRLQHMDVWRSLQEHVVFVSGQTGADKRKKEYDKVKDASNMIICATYGVAAVGINIPRIFNLVLIEPGKSFVRVIQSIGRSVRIADDKDFAQIWDITSSCKYAKRHLTTRKRFYREAQYPHKVAKIKWL